MPSHRFILAIDQGTTSSRAIVFDLEGKIKTVAQKEFKQIYPQDGWVEHNPEDIWQTTLEVCRQAIKDCDEVPTAIGITNQRETTIVWHRHTGKPIYNAIVWQDRRTADVCQQMKDDGLENNIASKTGLLLDPYFSATKIAWILDHVDGARALAKSGDLAFGTIDTFLLWRLTGGRIHATDATNASRTSLFNIHDLNWDRTLLDQFRIPSAVLPEVKQCTDDYGSAIPDLFGQKIPICGVAGDQQAATVGQACFHPGMMKSTYGTGCFAMLNTGVSPLVSNNRMLTTVAYTIDGITTYALEGSIFMAGAAVQWLRDGIGVIESAKQTEALAESIPNNRGVYLVPAFTGLGAPHWDPHARGAIFGMTRDTGVAEIVRATLESICYQTHDLMAAMTNDGAEPTSLRVDGGMVTNNWFCQFLADTLGISVERPKIIETTALGAAYLAGLQSGLLDSLEHIEERWQRTSVFDTATTQNQRNTLIAEWKQAIRATQSFSQS